MTSTVAARLDYEFWLKAEEEARRKEEAAEVKARVAARAETEAPDDEYESRLLQNIGAFVAEEMAKRDARIAALEASQLKLGGVYKSGVRYEANTLVSHQGGLWLSRAPTEAKPGGGSPAWRLAVKSGDAK